MRDLQALLAGREDELLLALDELEKAPPSDEHRPTLLSLLSSPSATVRSSALRGLVRSPSGPPSQATLLSLYLDDASPWVREGALLALRRGQIERASVPRLLAALSADDERRSRAAQLIAAVPVAEAEGGYREAASSGEREPLWAALVACLSRPAPVSLDALRALSAVGASARSPALDAQLARLLSYGSGDEKSAAVQMAAQVYEGTPRAEAALRVALTSAEREVRWGAIAHLLARKAPFESLTAEVAALVTSTPDARERAQALQLLGVIGEPSASAEALCKALGDEAWWVRVSAVHALAALSARGFPVLPLVEPLLSRTRTPVAVGAADVVSLLAATDPAARALLARIACETSDGFVAQTAARALGAVADEASLSGLVETLLTSKSALNRRRVAFVLSTVGARVAPLASRISPALTDPDLKVRAHICGLLAATAEHGSDEARASLAPLLPSVLRRVAERSHLVTTPARRFVKAMQAHLPAALPRTWLDDAQPSPEAAYEALVCQGEPPPADLPSVLVAREKWLLGVLGRDTSQVAALPTACEQGRRTAALFGELVARRTQVEATARDLGPAGQRRELFWIIARVIRQRMSAAASDRVG